MALPPRHRLARAIAAAELPIVLVIAPLLLFPTPTRLLVLTAMPVVWLCARITTGHAIPPTAFTPALALLLAMVGVSAAVTPDLSKSLDKIAGTLLGVVLFWALARWMTSPRRLAAAAAAFACAGGALAMIGLVGAIPPVKYPALSAIHGYLPRLIHGMPGAAEGFNPNAVAGCLVLFVPVQLAFINVSRAFGDRSRAARGAAAAVLAVTVFSLVLMQSRGAWISLAIAALAAIMWMHRRGRWLIAAGVTGAALLVAARPEIASLFTAETAAPNELPSTLAARIELWSRAVDGIRDFPFTGMGMNAFRHLMPTLYPTFVVDPLSDVAHAHNNFLQTALDLGLPGLAAYVMLWVTAARMLTRAIRRGESILRAIAIGLACGLAAHFLFGLTDAIALGTKVGIFFWMALALTARLGALAGAQPASATTAAATARA